MPFADFLLCLLIHPTIFIEHLLCARLCSGLWKNKDEKGSQGPLGHGIYHLVGRVR